MTGTSTGWRRLRTVVMTMTAVSSAAILGLAPPMSGVASAQPAPPQAGSQPQEGLDKVDRDRVAVAEQNGAPRVTLLIAAEPGRTAEVAQQLTAVGGVVEQTEESVDYVKVSVPTDQAERAAKVSAIAAVDVDGLIALDDPRPDAQAAPAAQKAPDATTPRVNPYMPTTDTGAAEFGQRRGLDGTGTTIAVLDSGVSLDHPALNTLPSGGRKIVDWYNANATNSGDGTWVPIAGSFRGAFTAAGRNWVAPTTGGPYAAGVLNEGAQDLGAAGSDFGADLDRDGVLRENFGILQDTATKEVFVDLDNDGDFTDQPRMIDYKVRYDVGYFGTDNPATAIAERMAFVVQTDKTGFVGIGISGSHGSHVAGIAAGSKLFGGQMAGAAPGAKIISIKACLAATSCTASGLLDGVIYGAKAGADVMNISIGGLPALNDGNNARAELYNRTIAEFGMQLFISAGNSGAGANSVGDPSVATDALSVASSITDDTWLSNYGSVAPAAEGLHPFSSRGPREDGGFKPQLAAPGSAISTTPPWQPGGPVAGTYELPPGYSMFNGTSMASPQATGAAALVVAAYKAVNRGQRPDPAALRTALMSGARYVKNLGAYEQGAGVVDVQRSVALLIAGGLTRATDKVTTSVPVSTALSGLLATPNTGVGIHDREGVQADYTRNYTLTRTTGRPGNQIYLATWQGNDGTFSTRSFIQLPLNQPVTLPVRIKPTGQGVHSAILRLDNPTTLGIDAQTMNVVFAPTQFAAANGFAGNFSGEVGRNQTRHFFVNVPRGTSALKVDLTGGGTAAGAGQVRFLRYDPTGIPQDATSSLNCYNPPVNPGGSCTGGAPTSRTTVNPTAGVWEIVVEARRTSDATFAKFGLSVTALGAVISPNPDTIASATVGVPVARTYTVRNTQAAFTGRLTGGPMASASIQRPTIAEAAQQQYQVTVPAGATAISARTGNPSDTDADLDLSLFNCTTGTCVLAGSSAGATSDELITVANPAAGRWIVLVDGYAVPAGTTAYDYRDSVSSPVFGAVAVTDTNANRASGSTWTAPATVTAATAPGAGRQLVGPLAVVTDSGAQIASGEVIVQSVTAAAGVAAPR